MNRALRRALQGGRGARQQREQQLTARLERLESENAELRETVTALDAKHDRVPGVTEGKRDWFVLVGGQRVNLAAMPPAEWIETLGELPGFLFSFAVEQQARPGEAPSSDTLEQVAALARRWIMSSAISLDGIDMAQLTVPEAQHAVAHIAELNGVSAALRTWFRERLAGMAATASGSAELRGEAKRVARPPSN